MLDNLAGFHDLPAALGFNPPVRPTIKKGELLAHLGSLPIFPSDFAIERGKNWIHDGVQICELSWSVGYGPRTQALLLTPKGSTAPLPGALFLHSHDDVKEYGKEKIVEGASDLPDHLRWVREVHYGDRAPANELAKRGFAVLAFDCFLWGSRRFPLENMPARLLELLGSSASYESLAVMHESMVISKYLSLFGATLAGLLNFDDRVAFAVAQSLPEISDSISTIGLSGGGARALYLHATQPEVRATVSIGAMATYQSMIPQHIAPHSWMFFPHDLAQKLDWPCIAMLGAPTPIYLQFCGDDQLFTVEGMQTADEMISSAYSEQKSPYKSDFYPVKHSFTVEMQESAFDWMQENA